MLENSPAVAVERAGVGDQIADAVGVDDDGPMPFEAVDVVFIAQQELSAAAIGFDVPLRRLGECRHVNDPLYDRA